MGRHLGDEDVVDAVFGEGGIRGDEPRVATHDLHQADAVGVPSRLTVSATHDADRLRKSRLEAEAFINVLEVVIDRLGDSDDTDPKASS